MANTTKKYRIQQLQSDESLLTLHPETDASIVNFNNDTTHGWYATVEDAIVEIEDKVYSLEESVENLPSSLVTGVKGGAESEYRNGEVNITKANIGLGNVDNTSDANKPISTAQKAVNDAQATTNTNLGNRITALEGSVGGLSGAMQFLGATSTPITDGGTQAPTINNVPVSTSTLKSGNVVLYNNQEFVWDGSKWELFGDEGSYVLKTRKINGYTLDKDITLDANDIYTDYDEVETIAERFNVIADDLAERQTRTDNNLTTTSKQVVGAINEVNTTATNANTRSTTNTAAITSITNGTTKVGKAGTADTATSATTATKFASAQSIALTGDVTGSASSQAGWSIATTLKNSGVTAGTYSAVTVNEKGIVKAGAKMIEVGGTTPSSSLATGGIFFKEI